jgi:hypothetical protein
MAETTETTESTQPVETAAPDYETGAIWMAIINGADTYGYIAEVAWAGDLVTTRRKSSGRGGETTTAERDTVTENALLSLVVPGVRPPFDFRLMILADDCTGVWPGFLHLSVRGGKAEIIDRTGASSPANIPAWFLGALRDLVLVDDGED